VRKYLEAKGELPARSVVAMVPMSTRSAVKDIDASNQISMTAVPIASDVAAPLDRLRAVRRGSGKSKAMSNALGKDLPSRLLNILPATATRLLLTKGLMSLANITVSNVRGPDIPLYLAGARLQSFLPVSAILSGLGLNVTGFSYNGTLWVCAVCCRKAMPDPAFFAECLKESFNDLVAAAADLAPAAKESAAAIPGRRPTRTRAAAKEKAATPATPEPAAAAAKPKRRRTVARPVAAPATPPAEPAAGTGSGAATRKPRKERSPATTRSNKAGAPKIGKDDAAA
jgi:hypothetical protein